MWEVVLNDEGERHVMPRGDDLGPHWAHRECWCRPTEDDGVLVHHSHDGRERNEAKPEQSVIH